MFSKFRPRGADPAMGAPSGRLGRLTGLIRPEVKRVGVIVGAGLILAFLTSNLDLKHRGAAPLLCLAGSVLVAFCDYYRDDRRVFTLLVAVSAMAAFVALAATRTPFTKSATVEATTAGNQAAIAGPGMVWDGLKGAANWTLHTAFPWVLNVGIPGSIDFLKGLGS